MQVGTHHTAVNFAVAAWHWPNYSEEKKMHGINLVVGKYKRPSPESGPVFAKVGGLYVSSTLVKNDATALGFDDAIMLDWRDFIAESSTSNVFFAKEEEIHTPIPDCFLNGITRQTVIEIAKNMGIKVIERHIKLADLKDYTDGFTTGSAAEVCKISSVTTRDLKQKYEFKENTISSTMLKEYQKLVKD